MRQEGEGNHLKVVKGIDKKGNIDAVDPLKAKPNQFLIFDRNADALENFFKNFVNQAKNPSHTGFYAVTADMLDTVLKLSEKELEKFRINPKDYLGSEQKQTTAQSPAQSSGQAEAVAPGGEKAEKTEPESEQKVDYTKFTASLIPGSEYEKYGITPETIQGEMNAMCYGFKSPHLIDIKPVIDGVEYPMKARLSLEALPDGSTRFVTHPCQNQPDLDKPFMGVVFTEEDKKAFLTTGNGGRVFELEAEAGGEKVPSLVSLDRLTNLLEAVPLSDIRIQQTLKNAPLSQEQQQDMQQGKAVWIEGMDKRVKPGEAPAKIDRFVQYNAVNRNLDFRFSDEQRQKYGKSRRTEQEPGSGPKIPKAREVDGLWVYSKQRGVQLSREQFDTLCGKEPVFVRNMQRTQVEATDRKGQQYNAWIWIDENLGKVRHTTRHPDQVRAMEAKQPAAGYHTQVAVNNEGKTSEATKHSPRPLKKGQTQPAEGQAGKQSQQQQTQQPQQPYQKQSPATQKKNRGRKM